MKKTIRSNLAALAIAAVALCGGFISSAAQAVSSAHIPDSFLPAVFNGSINLSTDTIKCALIDITSYTRTTDVYLSDVTQISGAGYTAGGQTVTSVVVTADTTNHKTTVVITPSVWSGPITASATGAACYDVTASSRLVAIDDFGGTVASTASTFTVAPIDLNFTHF